MTDPPGPNRRCDPNSIRGRLERALAGEVVDRPVYAVYDWFVQNRPIDWQSLFARGLGQIAHADLVRVERPNVEIVETTREIGGRVRRDVRWITDRGELREWYLGEWRQEYLIKCPQDYRIMPSPEGTRYSATSEPFWRAEQEIGDGGSRLASSVGADSRTPLLQVQIDFAGPERSWTWPTKCRS